MFIVKKPLCLSILITACFALTSCSDSTSSKAGADFDDGINSPSPTAPNFDKLKLVDSLINNVFLPSIDNFVLSAKQQSTAVNTYCDDLVTNQAESNELKAQAQSAWSSNMVDWQRIEMMQVGPLLNNDSQLKNVIYSWPVTNQCAVDQDVGNYESGVVSGSAFDITRRTVTRRGLDALEYLLFSQTLEHSCPNDSYAPSGWNQRTEIDRKIARCEFAKEVADDVNNNALILQQEWTKQGGFKDTLLQAGESGNAFDDLQSALNHITDAMFYLDSITKDAKLASPIGLADNSCDSAACLASVESLLSNNIINNLKANMQAFQQLFFAAPMVDGNVDINTTAHIGFDDYLKQVSAEALAQDMQNDIQSALDTIDAFEGTFADAVVNNPAKIQQLHQSVKKVTDNLKSSFMTYLSLSLPLTSAGDAD